MNILVALFVLEGSTFSDYVQIPTLTFCNLLVLSSGVARTPKKLRTSKGDYWIKQWFSSIASLFEIGTSIKGKREQFFFL